VGKKAKQQKAEMIYKFYFKEFCPRDDCDFGRRAVYGGRGL
jgi:hypothetical protein